jgi:hypothetical protein
MDGGRDGTDKDIKDDAARGDEDDGSATHEEPKGSEGGKKAEEGAPLGSKGSLVSSGNSKQLYKCEPYDWMWLPPSWRKNLGWAYLIIFALCFLSVPIALIVVFPVTWKLIPYFCTSYLALLSASMVWPQIEWLAPWFVILTFVVVTTTFL